MLRHPLVRAALLVLISWTLLSLAGRLLGFWGLCLIILLATLVAVTAWMLRYERRRLSEVYRYAGCRHFIDLVCRLTGEQPPVEATSRAAAPEDSLQLVNADHFDAASRRLKQVIRGHDRAIDQLLDRLQKNVVLHNTQQHRPHHTPLGVFLLAGPRGIGKRYLVRKMGRLVYQKPAVTELDMALYRDADAQAALFGSEGQTGELVAAVKALPYHTVILDNIELASDRVQQTLAQLLRSGTLTDPATGGTVSFQHCLFALLTTAGTTTLAAARERADTRRAWNQASLEALAAETACEVPLLSLVQDFLLLDRPAPITQAEIILLMMKKEAAKYGIRLGQVDHRLIANEVSAVDEAHGFALAPNRVQNLLHDPIVRAMQLKQPQLTLNNHDITMVRTGEMQYEQ